MKEEVLTGVTVAFSSCWPMDVVSQQCVFLSHVGRFNGLT